MKRIDITYGGQLYSVGGREIEDLTDEITAAVRDGGGWIRVNDGEGERRDALLFVSTGTSIAVIPIPATGGTD
ncbi:hypothetical protein [Microbacterium sp. P01]|uniref:hypothetical protein n=1 Tax=unclassified Microbacterium TaxID=2609290 RepID=UPI00366AF01B